MKKILLTLVAALGLAAGTAQASENAMVWDKAPDKTTDLGALQNGAKVFVNYCVGCHSAAFMRYNRLRDIGLTEQQIKDNLLFTTDKVGETMKAAIDPTPGQGLVRRQSARLDPDRPFARWRRRQRGRLPLHFPAHLLPRRHQGDGLEQSGLPERRYAPRAVGIAGIAQADLREVASHGHATEVFKGWEQLSPWNDDRGAVRPDRG